MNNNPPLPNSPTQESHGACSDDYDCDYPDAPASPEVAVETVMTPNDPTPISEETDIVRLRHLATDFSAEYAYARQKWLAGEDELSALRSAMKEKEEQSEKYKFAEARKAGIE